MRAKLHFYLTDKNNKYARMIDGFIYLIILITVFDHGLQTMASMEKYHVILDDWELVPIVLFSIEYILRVFAAPNRLKYIFSFWGILDSVALIPYYFGLPADLREIRVLRFISIFKYDPAIVNIRKAFNDIKKELIIFSILTIFLLYVAAVGIYHFENPAQPENFADIFHSMWWAVATLTTVGYGDIYPITAGGKIFSSVIVFISLGVVAVPAGLIASAFSDIFKNKE